MNVDERAPKNHAHSERMAGPAGPQTQRISGDHFGDAKPQRNWAQKPQRNSARKTATQLGAKTATQLGAKTATQLGAKTATQLGAKNRTQFRAQPHDFRGAKIGNPRRQTQGTQGESRQNDEI
jgi:hypothetical protein